MQFSVFFLAALALIACASAALELRCSSGTLQGVGGTIDGIYSTKTSVQRPVRKSKRRRGNSVTDSRRYLWREREKERNGGLSVAREVPERHNEIPRYVFD
jgi:hypothetical protein